MKSKFNEVFASIQDLDPPSTLEGFILARIRRERKKIMRERKALVGYGLLGSAIAIIYTLSLFGQEILRSDFWRIGSLAFSDINIITGNWYDYTFSLLETFPALHVAMMLVPIFVLLIFLNSYINLTENNNHRHI